MFLICAFKDFLAFLDCLDHSVLLFGQSCLYAYDDDSDCKNVQLVFLVQNPSFLLRKVGIRFILIKSWSKLGSWSCMLLCTNFTCKEINHKITIAIKIKVHFIFFPSNCTPKLVAWIYNITYVTTFFKTWKISLLFLIFWF